MMRHQSQTRTGTEHQMMKLCTVHFKYCTLVLCQCFGLNMQTLMQNKCFEDKKVDDTL